MVFTYQKKWRIYQYYLVYDWDLIGMLLMVVQLGFKESHQPSGTKKGELQEFGIDVACRDF